MKKGPIIQGNHLIDFINEMKGYTIWSGNKEIENLSVIDLTKWYYVSRWGTELYIVEVEAADSPEKLKDQIL
jgi:hypothetical protein